MMPRKAKMNGTNYHETEQISLDTKIGFKTEPLPSAKPSKKSLSQCLKKIYLEYCSNTSLHGVQYFGQQRPWTETIFWIFVFVISVYFCSETIINIHQKWQDTPVIVTFSERSIPISSIPFPAITICSESKRNVATEEGSLYGDLLNAYNEGLEVPSNITSKELEEFLTLIQVCSYQPDGDKSFKNFKYKPLDYIKVLNEMSFPLPSLMGGCLWSGVYDDCDDLFTTTYTEDGLCFTFNGFNGTDLYRENTVQYQMMGLESRNNVTTMRLNRTLNWSLDKGYPTGIPLKAYPARVLSGNTKTSFNMALMMDKDKLDYGCSGPTQGFKIVLHTPDDVPLMSKRFVRLSLGTEISIVVKPIMVTTTGRIDGYSPEKRRCYLPGERDLEFFKVYSEKNCEMECLTKYTLKQCGCVKFSMPRTPEMKVCGANNITCYTEAEELLLLENFNDGDGDNDGCKCLPSCTSLEYDTEISQADYDAEQMSDVVKGADDNTDENENEAIISTLLIYFKDNEFITFKRSELFGFTEFLANCGGILGLFMGFSFLSAIEVLYHCTLRLWTNMRR